MTNVRYKEAIGLETKRGRPAVGRKPGKKELQRLYIKESQSIRDIANILDCSKDIVFRALKEYRIERRSQAKRSKLLSQDIKFLEKKIQEKGYRKVAKGLDINHTTLMRFMKKRKGIK